MTGSDGFWDASAVVPLCLWQANTVSARAVSRRLRLVVWWGTAVEVQSAISRLARAAALSSSGVRGAQRHLARLAREWTQVEPSRGLSALAVELLYRHSLRAADALQLAAAIEWCGGRPRRRAFVCRDDRLSQAAEAEEFDVIRL